MRGLWAVALLGTLAGCAPVAERAPAMREVDALKASPANFRLLLENERVRVLEYSLAPGQRDAWHTHPAKLSYVLAGGRLRIHLPDATPIEVIETTGEARWSEMLGAHSAENVGDAPVRIVLVEVKSR